MPNHDLSSIVNRLSAPIRGSHWWKYKAAHILGFAYFYFYALGLPFQDALILLGLSAITITGIAGLGYVINDLYDMDADAKAGKSNRLAGMSVSQRFLIVVLLLSLAFLPWLVLRWVMWTWILIGAEMLLFLLYAHPAIRLKEKYLWGPVCDALYGHALPVIIACITYQQYGPDVTFSPVIFFMLLFLWQFLKGLRNIFLHQMEDIENDITSGINTYTVSAGSQKVYRIVMYRILPAEVIFGVGFLALIFWQAPFILYGFLFFLAVYILGHGLFRNTLTGPEHFRQNTYLYFLNDWYEDYFPWIFLFACLFIQPIYVILMVFHLLLFPTTAGKIGKDLIEAGKEVSIRLNLIIDRMVFIIKGRR